MTVEIESEAKQAFDFDYKELIDRVIYAAVDYEKCPYEVEVSVLLTDDPQIKELNLEHREIDAATDVLSFPAVDFKVPADFDMLEDEAAILYFNQDTGELFLGDIVVSVEHVVAQAKEYGHSRERELGFLVAHSMLHLFGYDHIKEDERAVMEQKQREILDGIGLSRQTI